MNMRFFNKNKHVRMENRFHTKIALAIGIMVLFLSMSQGAFAQFVFVPGQGFVLVPGGGTTPPPPPPPPPPGGGGAVPGVNPVTGFPFFMEDAAGVRTQLCDQIGAAVEAPPCPGLALTDPAAGVVAGNIVEAIYYAMNGALDGPNGELFLAIIAVEAAGGDPTLPPPDNADIVSNHVLIRLRNLVSPGPYNVVTPFGTFGPFTATVDAQGRIRDIVETPLIAIGTAADLPTAFGNAATGPVNDFIPNGTGAPGFLGDGITPAPLVRPGPGGAVFSVTGPGINVSTNAFAVEGKLFGVDGLNVEQATVATGATPQVVMLVSSNLTNPTITVSGPAGSPLPNEPIALTVTAPPAAGQPTRFFGAFNLGTLNPATQQLVFTATAAGAPAITQTVPIEDVVTVTNASFDTTNNTLTVNAASNFAGLAGVAAPTLTVTDQNGNNLGTVAGGALATVVAVPPSTVTVTSSEGGSTTATVSFAGAATPPPGGGTTPPPPPPPPPPPTGGGGFVFVPGVGFVAQ